MTNPTPRTVPEVIAASRAEQKLTLEEFAEALGINSRQNVSNWERGVNEPSGERLASWIHDEREWVSQLAEEIFVARYRQSLKAVIARPAPITIEEELMRR